MDTLIHINRAAPDFGLPDLSGSMQRLAKERGRVVVLNFWSAECPWSDLLDQFLGSWLLAWGERVAWWSVAANANEPADLLVHAARQRGLPIVLQDTGHRVTDLYQAQTTPHVFVIDPQGFLRYQGAPYDATFRSPIPARHYLQQAVDAVLSGRCPDPSYTPPYGCAIVRFAA